MSLMAVVSALRVLVGHAHILEADVLEPERSD